MSDIPDKRPEAILITGPTASGKSALALRLARKHGGEVINADSMQVYDTLRLLTARPSEDEMEGIAHHLYGTVPAGALFSTGEWLRAVAPLVDEVRGRGHVPVFVGGTGMYFRALTGGLSDMPSIAPEIREALRARLASEGAGALHRELALLDPEAALTLRSTDGQRIVRALEVLQSSGRSIRTLQQESGQVVVDPSRALKLVVEPDRAVLHDRINRRFGQMMEQGAINEVEALLALGLETEMPVMKAIGVPQIAAMLEGRLSRQDAIAQASAATRQYAKRQSTWFRNQLDDSWLRLGGTEDSTRYVD